jgi:hypothetical protein
LARLQVEVVPVQVILIDVIILLQPTIRLNNLGGIGGASQGLCQGS